ncbi:MAG: hypothetical protein HFE65_02870 [Clostridiales bacterium]|nr:hypothetical protein [Clostridiales bacterium]
MKHKFLCVLLCICMLASTGLLSSCANNSSSGTNAGTDTTDEGGSAVVTRSSMTLTLWVPTSPDTTEEAIALTEEAINQITQPLYDTAIKLYAIPEDEYDDAIREQVHAIETRIEEQEKAEIEKRKQEIENAKNGVDATTAAETTKKTNEADSKYSLIVNSAPQYPHVESTQMDIFLMRGLDEYEYYANNMYLSALDESLTGSSKVLKSYIFPDFLTAAVVDGATYGIPNNHAIGEYTYFLVNKRLVEEEYLDPATLTSMENAQQFIEDVATYHPGVTPVYGVYEPSSYEYWSGQDSQTFSVIASRITKDSSYDVAVNNVFRNIFSMNNYVQNTYLYKSYVEKGYVSTSDNVGEFGVGFIKGTPEDIKAYEDDYYINIHQAPRGTKEEYCRSVFGISSYTKSVPRAMEILTLLNTDTEMRTMLQYGAKGTHWKYDEENENIIVQLSDEYKMNLQDTGNEFITFPDYGVSMKYWDAAKQQNLDSYYPITATFTGYQNEENKALLAELDALNQQIKAEVDAMSAAEFKTNTDQGILQERVEQSDAYQKLTYVPSSSDPHAGRTEANGWLPNASIVNLWKEYVTELLGKEPGAEG